MVDPLWQHFSRVIHRNFKVEMIEITNFLNHLHQLKYILIVDYVKFLMVRMKHNRLKFRIIVELSYHVRD